MHFHNRTVHVRYEKSLSERIIIERFILKLLRWDTQFLQFAPKKAKLLSAPPGTLFPSAAELVKFAPLFRAEFTVDSLSVDQLTVRRHCFQITKSLSATARSC